MRVLPFAVLAAALASCVSLEEAVIARGSVQPGQRTVLLVYAAPAPLVADSDSKAETAAKIVPGLGLVVQDAQNQGRIKASKDLGQYLPAWDPAGKFRAALLQELELTGYPGKFVTREETQLSAEDAARLDRAADVVDWQDRFFLPLPDGHIARNYSRFLSLDDALVFEANLLYGTLGDEEGNAKPTLAAAVRLVRANNMRQLWYKQESVEDAAEPWILYDYKLRPHALVARWEKLMPPLAAAVAKSLRENLQKSGAFAPPVIAVMPQQDSAPAPTPPELSTATVAAEPPEQPAAAAPQIPAGLTPATPVPPP